MNVVMWLVNILKRSVSFIDKVIIASYNAAQVKVFISFILYIVFCFLKNEA